MSDARESKWRLHGVRVVHADDLDINTPQTPGMNRAAAITRARAGAEKLWAGTVVIHPKAKTGPHHHGPVESVPTSFSERHSKQTDPTLVAQPPYAVNAGDASGEVFLHLAQLLRLEGERWWRQSVLIPYGESIANGLRVVVGEERVRHT